MNLFKKIWNKNFLKAKEPLDKFSEDIGGLRGEFTWTKIINGQKVESSTFHNDLTDLSKNTVIRLLAQGTSSWRDTIVPANYKISRMRFGNAPFSDHNTDLTLNYYDISEISSRNNLTNSLQYSPAGGRYTTGTVGQTAVGTIGSESGSLVSKSISKSSYPSWGNGVSISVAINQNFFDYTGSNVTNYNQERPPSHKTVVVELMNESLSTVFSTITYGSVYSRNTEGVSATNVTNLIGANASTTLADHIIKYEFPVGSESGYWRIQFKLGATVSDQVTKVRISFKIGQYNIINSIVPVIGYNLGSGKTGSVRFPNAPGTEKDYYVVTTPDYANSPSGSFIDDYSATFRVTMTQTQGNGSSGLDVHYTEAFLFNGLDDLFSIIRFPYYTNISETPRGFPKNAASSYLISWTIKSIV